MSVRIYRENDYLKSDWSGGTSTQFFIYPPNSSLVNRDFLFRISSAKIDVEVSEFSDFKGYQRIFLPLKGRVVIEHKDSAAISLNTYEIIEFDGDLATNSIGKCVDFNLIFRPELRAEVEVLSLKKGEIFKIETNERFDFHVLYLHRGEMITIDERLSVGETALWEKEIGCVEWTATEESSIILSRISLKKD